MVSGGTLAPDFEIRTYSDTHATDIYTNGEIISHEDSITLATAIVDTNELHIKDSYTFL